MATALIKVFIIILWYSTDSNLTFKIMNSPSGHHPLSFDILTSTLNLKCCICFRHFDYYYNTDTCLLPEMIA